MLGTPLCRVAHVTHHNVTMSHMLHMSLAQSHCSTPWQNPRSQIKPSNSGMGGTGSRSHDTLWACGRGASARPANSCSTRSGVSSGRPGWAMEAGRGQQDPTMPLLTVPNPRAEGSLCTNTSRLAFETQSHTSYPLGSVTLATQKDLISMSFGQKKNQKGAG